MAKQAQSNDPIAVLMEADARGETTPEQHAAVVRFREAMAAILTEEI